MTLPEIDALLGLCEKATEGPWEADGDRIYGEDAKAPGDPWIIGTTEGDIPGNRRGFENAAFIAAARSALPKLLAEAKRLQPLKDAVRAAGMDMDRKGTHYRSLPEGAAGEAFALDALNDAEGALMMAESRLVSALLEEE